jgi:hypothetical protein
VPSSHCLWSGRNCRKRRSRRVRPSLTSPSGSKVRKAPARGFPLTTALAGGAAPSCCRDFAPASAAIFVRGAQAARLFRSVARRAGGVRPENRTAADNYSGDFAAARSPALPSTLSPLFGEPPKRTGGPPVLPGIRRQPSAMPRVNSQAPRWTRKHLATLARNSTISCAGLRRAR